VTAALQGAAGTLALAVTAGALLAGLVALATTRRPAAALPVFSTCSSPPACCGWSASRGGRPWSPPPRSSCCAG
jgi:hypothetical protein